MIGRLGLQFSCKLGTLRVFEFIGVKTNLEFVLLGGLKNLQGLIVVEVSVLAEDVTVLG